jgi:hypothetical protein
LQCVCLAEVAQAVGHQHGHRGVRKEWAQIPLVVVGRAVAGCYEFRSLAQVRDVLGAAGMVEHRRLGAEKARGGAECR